MSRNKLSENGDNLDRYFNEDAVRRQLLVQKYATFLKNANKVTGDEAKQQYTDYHTAHILISNKSRPDAQAQALANQVIQQLNKGGDFAALAKQYSDDPGTKNKGGDDGWVTKDTQYVPEFIAGMKTLQKGQITQQPIVSPQFGYFIIKLYDTRSSQPKYFEKINESEISQLQNKQVEDAYEADLKKAQAAEKLVIKDNRLKLDHGMMGLYQHMGTDGKFDQGEVQKLIKGYTELAKSVSADSDQVAQIDADLGQLQGMVDGKDPKTLANLQIPEFASALKAFGHPDQQVDQKLADLYQRVGDNNNAVKYLLEASSATYGDPRQHMTYSGTFRKLGRADLAEKELQLAVQEQQQAPAGGLQSGPTASVQMPSSPQPQPVTVGGKPMPARHGEYSHNSRQRTASRPGSGFPGHPRGPRRGDYGWQGDYDQAGNGDRRCKASAEDTDDESTPRPAAVPQAPPVPLTKPSGSGPQACCRRSRPHGAVNASTCDNAGSREAVGAKACPSPPRGIGSGPLKETSTLQFSTERGE